jgi:hypothetical protein
MSVGMALFGVVARMTVTLPELGGGHKRANVENNEAAEAAALQFTCCHL